MRPRILLGKNYQDWVSLSAETISQDIRSVVEKKGRCHVMLTGGKTVRVLYNKWASMSTFPFQHLSFLFGDERCVLPGHAESNYALVMNTLLVKGTPSGCSIMRMEAENPDQEAAAGAYEKLIPDEIDVLLLGVGDDGHVASLFPGSSALLMKERSVVSVRGPKAPHQRLTITPRVIASADEVFVLATGERKGRVLAEALKPESSFMSLPVLLTLNGTWLLDADAGRQLQ
jgi:6-phosphogluconolactonase